MRSVVSPQILSRSVHSHSKVNMNAQNDEQQQPGICIYEQNDTKLEAKLHFSSISSCAQQTAACWHSSSCSSHSYAARTRTLLARVVRCSYAAALFVRARTHPRTTRRAPLRDTAASVSSVTRKSSQNMSQKHEQAHERGSGVWVWPHTANLNLKRKLSHMPYIL